MPAATGSLAAGHVVTAFGEFVAGDQLVVGMIIFVIIVVIQFVVITKGATRISEVAARFALDGMPGRQMAIDADLNAGSIDEARSPATPAGNHAAGRLFRRDGRCQQVRARRCDRRHLHHADQHRRRLGHRHGRKAACRLRKRPRFSRKLTIGDGLVSQVPAFLISLAAGLLVTRSTQKANLPRRVHAADVLASAGTGRDGWVSWGCWSSPICPRVPLLALVGGSCVGTGA